ncbi:MAG: adenosylcobinamide-phosphate synthase CbiB [Planctomycetota bacterium]|nr:adenosylcobinamide-phosphate synthase CbiB [Planctomycetota bacterium]
MSMRLEYQVPAAFALDLLIGDPRWLPHPVKLIGWCAGKLEAPVRRAVPFAYVAGLAAWMLIVGGAGGITWGVLWLAAWLHPVAYDVAAVLLLYTTFAARDLVDHSRNVLKALRAGDLPEARRRVSMIVGRDTGNLDEAGVTRAAVESVAESTVDGVTAPLFFAVVGGPVGAMAYKAVNTLDSMFGHKEERYSRFGWASARLDDVANYIPARVTAPLVALTAAVLGYRPVLALRVLARDGRKHASPNAGLPEAAVAGALNVQLGGLNYYGGEPHQGALIGDPNEPLMREHISRANALMLGTAVLALLVFVGARVLVLAWAGEGAR